MMGRGENEVSYKCIHYILIRVYLVLTVSWLCAGSWQCSINWVKFLSLYPKASRGKTGVHKTNHSVPLWSILKATRL